MDEFFAVIKYFAFPWAPDGWAPCYGQLLPIAHNEALFSLIGTYYGGDGQHNFALPDLRPIVDGVKVDRPVVGQTYNGSMWLNPCISISGVYPPRP